jgi:peroxiredoxin
MLPRYCDGASFMNSCKKEESAGLRLAILERGPRRATIYIALALAMSVALNVILAHRVRSMTHERSAQITDYQLQIGTTVAPIQAKHFGGQQEIVSYQDTTQFTVIYVFTPACTWCARNLDNFKALVHDKKNEYRFIGVSLTDEGLAEYVTKNQLKLPIYSGPSLETLKSYKLGSTPQTIVISPEGKVLQDWLGAYIGDQKSQVESFFHVNLPGVTPPS